MLISGWDFSSHQLFADLVSAPWEYLFIQTRNEEASTHNSASQHGTEEDVSLAHVLMTGSWGGSAHCDRGTELNSQTFPQSTAPPLYADLAL